MMHKRKQADRAKLEDLINLQGSKLLYEYDLGDSWQHEILWKRSSI
jgi:hypothetical protein